MAALDQLKEVFSEEQILTDEDSKFIYGKDWTTYFEPKPVAIVFPKRTEEVQKLVQLARKNKFALVPSGGRTGLSGGAVATSGEVVVSFEKMNQVIRFNEFDSQVHVQAGVITQSLQDLAEEKGLYFPVEFGASGSSHIAGNIATNAGGVHVLRYGNTRNWVAGLTVVTGDGEVLKLNRGLIKNATGYDLRHLFIGSEGTLGIITEAIIQLTRKPKDKTAVLLAVESWDKALELFKVCKKSIQLSAFECFTDDCMEYVVFGMQIEKPFEQNYKIYCLVEVEQDSESLNTFIDEVFDKELAFDGTLSQSSAQFSELWSYRENITECIARYKPYKNDVAVMTSQIPDFVKEMKEVLQSNYPDFRVLWFGHIGDGNLHINILKPDQLEVADFVAKCKQVDNLLFEKVKKFGGSISAEHGVGLTKKSFLEFSRDANEIAYMKALKQVFDPDGILNPGKIFEA